MSDPLDPTRDTSDDCLWEQKSMLAASVLSFRRDAAEVLDRLIVGLLQEGGDAGIATLPRLIKLRDFKTAKGRPCVLALGVGDEACKLFVNALKDGTHG